MTKGGVGLRISLVAAIALVSLALPSYGTNPANWHIDKTINKPTSNYYWTSPSFVDYWYPHYDYGYRITQVKIKIFGGWMDITGQIDDNLLSSSGSSDGGLPITFYSGSFEDPTGLAGLSANMKIYVDGSGWGHANITNIDWGNGIVSAIKIVADVWITGTPEPTTLLSFAGLGLAFIRRRKLI